ncbi:hypothetical protein E4634_02860 [Mangrovimicrobium sediminis]|uniref:DUF975 family protein n=1 Tax=Mangrovimicrobium sediminis TaxID=2562682 RepID=A0A4Z0M949_9GAMM|nr:hypothetical protein [Haliea sp. SAOS-164]TGD75825.1 hypothetical protein E4634_02860 [Haliea sp. SAOS-164]
MSDANRYSAPAAELYEPRVEGEYGSVENGIAGNYELRIGEVLSSAWDAIKGRKSTVLGASGLAFVVVLVYIAISGTIQFMFASEEGPGVGASLITLPIDFIYYAITAAMTAGFYVMGAKISIGLPVNMTDVFRYIGKLGKAFLTYLLMMFMVLVGLLLLVLPGIYLIVGYSFAVTLALEKGMSPWQALETSRKTVHHQWFKLFGLMLLIGVLGMLSVFTLGIALIWLVPLICVAYGTIYRDMFGLEQETLAS